jgi:LuxR family maltose regulon positive regulatory protein
MDPVLKTKLFQPRVLPGHVTRPRLVDQLDDGLRRGVVVISAPAGFGKTSLLAEWSDGQRVAWLSLDAGDNDPGRFWRHVIAALDQAVVGVADRVGPMLGPPVSPALEPIVVALINDVAETPDERDVALVLDDYHLIDSGAVHSSIGYLLEHRPPALRLVITGRADPPLPLARLRASGALAELRAADLRFTAEEAAALMRESDLDVPEPSVDALNNRTEGWPVGLQLAALALEGRNDVVDFVRTFDGSHRFVLDYLAEEVLERQTGDVREFLLATSVLDRLSADLCDAVTGRHDSEQMLDTIERANLFLLPLDDVRGWWRYHHMFADLLRVRLRREWPERVVDLHVAAARWFERNGAADDAIRHATASGDAQWAARLVEQHVDALLPRSELATLCRWLDALPDALVDARPRLHLAQALFALVSGHLEDVEDPLEAAERALPFADDEPFEPSTGRAASVVANVPAAIALGRAFQAELRGDAVEALRFGQHALAATNDDEAMLRAIIRTHLGVAEWQLGALGDAERDAAFGVEAFGAAGQVYQAIRACEMLGDVQRAQGRLDDAWDTAERALAIATASEGATHPAGGIAHLAMADVEYERDHLDGALEHVTEAISACRRLVYVTPLANGLATLAWIRQAQRDVAGATDAMEEAARVMPSASVASLLHRVPVRRAHLRLAQGDVAGAARFARARELGPGDELTYAREPEYLLLARLLMAQDAPDEALELLDRLCDAATAHGRARSTLEILVLQARALAATGDEPAAVTRLADALALAHPQQYVRLFADEGAPMRELVGRLVAAQRRDRGVVGDVPLEHLGRVVRALEPTPTAPSSSRTGGIPGLVDALTERELQVLGLLAGGKSNREIADELYISLDTVKKHVSHIFTKLGAVNRTEATARARALGLLEDHTSGSTFG